MQIYFKKMRALGLLSLSACLPAFATGLIVNVVGVTATQAILTYTAPDTNVCTVAASESSAYSPSVHDLDPALFIGAQRDSRAGNIVNGPSRIIVIGKRLADSMSLDGNTYSRALQANTMHYFRISCGASVATGTFTTTNIPLGMTYSDIPQVDRNNPGQQTVPTMIEDRNQTIVDPHTGALLKRVSLSADGATGQGAFLNFGGDSRMCGENLLGQGPGFLCAFANFGGGYALLYYIIPATGEARFLGQIPGLVYPEIDNADNKMYFNAYDANGKLTGVNRFTYVGDYSAAAAGSNALLTTEVFSAVSTSTLMQAFDPSYDAAKYPCGGIDVKGKYGLIECGRSTQDSYGWLGVLDMGNRQPIGNCGADPALCPHMIAADQVFANGITRWTGLHHVALLSSGIPLVSITTHGLSGAHTDMAVGPFNSTLLSAVSSTDTVLTISGDPASVQPDVYIGSWKVGDMGLLCQNGGMDTQHTTANEFVKIQAINTSGPQIKLTVERQWGGEYMAGGLPLFPALAHPVGTFLTAVGNNLGPGGGWLNVYWDFLHDPHGLNPIIDRAWPGGHEDSGSDLHITEGYHAVKGPFQAMIGTAPNFNLDQSPAFAGQRGLAFGNSYAAHPSYHQSLAPTRDKDWFLDMLPFFGGNLFSPNPGASLVSGQLYKYLFDSFESNGLYRKALATLAVSGTSALVDISGPGSHIDDTAVGSYTYCVAYLADECRLGSHPGDTYANVPNAEYTYCSSTSHRDVCVASFATNGQAVVQLGLIPNSVGETGGSTWTGAAYSRVLSNGLAGTRHMFEYASAKSLPDASWAMFGVIGSTTNVFIVKLPPFQADGVDRSTFLPIAVNLTAPSDNRIVSAIIEFGYAEQGSASQHFCTSRREACVAISSAVNQADPFKYAQSDSYQGAACAKSCAIVIPALPMHVTYYQAKYLDAMGKLVAVGEAGAAAETANAILRMSTLVASSQLPAPANLTGLALSSSQIQLSWTSASGAPAGFWIYRNGSHVATSLSSPYTDSGLAAAINYTYTVVAYDASGNVSDPSVPVSVRTAAPAPASVIFLKADTTTQGNWRAVYGADGYTVVGDLASNPAYAAPIASGQTLYTWAAATSDIRALQKASNSVSRIAATWYAASSFIIDSNITDSASHQVALYCLDWDSANRRQTIDVLDASGSVLNSQTLSGSFNGGVYLVWNVAGHVKFRVTRTAGYNAVVSGLFFDGVKVAPAMTTASVDLVTPNTGTGISSNFTFKYSSVNGSGYLAYVHALFNATLNGNGACWVYYSAASNRLFLLNDTQTSSTGPLTPGSSGTLQNSQCTLNGAGSSVTGAGNTLAMTLALTFKPSFSGTRTAFGSAFDNASLSSGWQAVGTWTPAALVATPPTADSVTPNAGGGTSGGFTFRYSSANGNGYLRYVHALFNGTLKGDGACWVYYSAAANGLFLLNDTQTSSTGPLTPGSSGTLQNSQCTLNGAGSSVTGAGNTLGMTLALTFKPSFSGTRTAFSSAFDDVNLTSGWQALGTWTPAVPVATPPTADLVTANAGAGTSGSFIFRYSSANGNGYLRYVHALINGTLNGNGACWVYYSAAANGLFLLNDTQSTSTGPLTPGYSGTLQNSQCTLNGAGSSVTGAGNTLAMTLALTFKPSFSGTQTAFGQAFDNASLTSGWQALGMWKTN